MTINLKSKIRRKIKIKKIIIITSLVIVAYAFMKVEYVSRG